MRRIVILATALYSALGASCAAAAGSLESALGAYVEGLRRGDAQALKGLFLGSGQFCRNTLAAVQCSSFADAIPSWLGKPDPAASGKIVSQEIVGDSMARVTYELVFNGDVYVDHLLLYKNNDRWLVVAKTTFVQ